MPLSFDEAIAAMDAGRDIRAEAEWREEQATMTKPLPPRSQIIDDGPTRAARGPAYLAGFEDGIAAVSSGGDARDIFIQTGLRVEFRDDSADQFLMRYRRQQAARR
jgi:hypothetical protein